VKLIITVGLPGSGKSTYLARLGVNAISSDEIRRLIADDPHDQTMNARIFAVVRYLIRQRIAAGRPVTYVDATHLTPWERKPYVNSRATLRLHAGSAVLRRSGRNLHRPQSSARPRGSRSGHPQNGATDDSAIALRKASRKLRELLRTGSLVGGTRPFSRR
jgi:predicted kinase